MFFYRTETGAGNTDTCCLLFKSYSQPSPLEHKATPAQKYAIAHCNSAEGYLKTVSCMWMWTTHLADSLQADFDFLSKRVDYYVERTIKVADENDNLEAQYRLLEQACDSTVMNMVIFNQYYTLLHCFDSKGNLVKRETFMNLIRKSYEQRR